MSKIKITGLIDLYDLGKNEITKRNIFRNESFIYKGQEIILYDDINHVINDNKKYVIVDYLEFCDRNNQIVYACLEDLREEKLKNILK
jgi:hypothetical protein